MHPPFQYQNQNAQRNGNNYNYEDELAKALRLSEESFKKEAKLREQAQKIYQRMQQQEKQKWSEEKAYSTLINHMQWKEMFINRGVGSGLQNLGNSCFMNATLQCLAYTPPFAQLLCQSNHSSHCKSNKFCALCEMEKVIPSMLMGKQIVKPRILFKHLPKINDLLTPGCQEDAHEFIQALLDRIEMAYDDAVKPSKKRDPQNPIRQLFTGATKTSILCARCKSKSVTKEPFCCISLEVDDNVGLGEALEIFTQDELLRGDDKYFCNKCNRKCIAHKKLTLSELPPILILHFKRFCVQFAASHHKQGTAKKLPDHVEFPETLDFKKIPNLIYEEDRQKVFIDSAYELYGVLVHSGPQLGYGHYYALIKAPNGRWYRMNDMDVIPVHIKHVLREQGYIVFYRRKTVNSMQSKLKQIQLKNGNNNNEMKMDVDADDDGNNKQSPKVDPSLLTHDYFANNCQLPDMVMVNNNDINQQNNNNSVNSANDRTSYVQVPPMATRPELISDKKPLNKNKGNQEAVEIFWPVTDLE